MGFPAENFMIIEPNGSFSAINIEDIKSQITKAMASNNYVDDFEPIIDRLALRAIAKITRNNKDIERFQVDRMIRDTLIECGYTNVANGITNDMFAELPDEFIVCRTHGVIRGNYDKCPRCKNENTLIKKYKAGGAYVSERPEPIKPEISSGKKRILETIKSDRAERGKENPILDQTEQKITNKENISNDTFIEKNQDSKKNKQANKSKKNIAKNEADVKKDIKHQVSNKKADQGINLEGIGLSMNIDLAEKESDSAKRYLFIVDESTERGKQLKSVTPPQSWQALLDGIEMLKTEIISNKANVNIVDAFKDDELTTKYGVQNVPTLVVENGDNFAIYVNANDILDNLG